MILALACLERPPLVDTGESAHCAAAIEEKHPDFGDEHLWRDPIRVTFESPPGYAELEVVGAVGESALVDRVLTWTPTEPLQPDTRYEVVADHVCGTTAWNFRTTTLGQPRTEAIVGRTYALDGQDGQAVEGEDAVLLSYQDRVLLAEVVAADDTLELLLAPLDEDFDRQACAETHAVELDFGEDPFFHLPPQPVEVGAWRFERLEVSGTFVADGSAIEGLRVEGVLDTRPLETGEDELCHLVAGFGIDCEPCEDGEPACLQSELEAASAVEVGQDLESIEDCTLCGEEACPSCGCGSPASGAPWLLAIVALARRRVPDSAA